MEKLIKNKKNLYFFEKNSINNRHILNLKEIENKINTIKNKFNEMENYINQLKLDLFNKINVLKNSLINIKIQINKEKTNKIFELIKDYKLIESSLKIKNNFNLQSLNKKIYKINLNNISKKLINNSNNEESWFKNRTLNSTNFKKLVKNDKIDKTETDTINNSFKLKINKFKCLKNNKFTNHDKLIKQLNLLNTKHKKDLI